MLFVLLYFSFQQRCSGCSCHDRESYVITSQVAAPLHIPESAILQVFGICLAFISSFLNHLLSQAQFASYVMESKAAMVKVNISLSSF